MTPSTTNKGWLSFPSEPDVPPRKIICAPEPAAPEDCVIFTPAIFPESDEIGLAVLFFMSSSALRSETAYPNDFLSFLIPNAVTTTSPNCTALSCRTTSITERLLTRTVKSTKPIDVKTREPLAGALIEYFPSTSHQKIESKMQ